jgi:hypothetical protein
VGRAFGYTPAARMTMWSLTLPQVAAATLAATLVAFDTRNPAGQRLVDSRLLNVVLVHGGECSEGSQRRPVGTARTTRMRYCAM